MTDTEPPPKLWHWNTIIPKPVDPKDLPEEDTERFYEE